MADRPVIFSAPMIRALLAGTKTQTRRLAHAWLRWAGDPPTRTHPFTAQSWADAMRDRSEIRRIDLDDSLRFAWTSPHPTSLGSISRWLVTPIVQPGDRLWVREAWHTHCAHDGTPPRDLPADAPIWFPADDDSSRPWGVARPSIHMPRWASRLTLTVTDVRAQRVQDISAADAEAEGAGHAAGLTGGQAREAFALLWDSIHGAGAWERNPEVVALTFTVARGNIDHG